MEQRQYVSGIAYRQSTSCQVRQKVVEEMSCFKLFWVKTEEDTVWYI